LSSYYSYLLRDSLDILEDYCDGCTDCDYYILVFDACIMD